MLFPLCFMNQAGSTSRPAKFNMRPLPLKRRSPGIVLPIIGMAVGVSGVLFHLLAGCVLWHKHKRSKTMEILSVTLPFSKAAPTTALDTKPITTALERIGDVKAEEIAKWPSFEKSKQLFHHLSTQKKQDEQRLEATQWALEGNILYPYETVSGTTGMIISNADNSVTVTAQYLSHLARIETSQGKITFKHKLRAFRELEKKRKAFLSEKFYPSYLSWSPQAQALANAKLLNESSFDVKKQGELAFIKYREDNQIKCMVIPEFFNSKAFSETIKSIVDQSEFDPLLPPRQFSKSRTYLHYQHAAYKNCPNAWSVLLNDKESTSVLLYQPSTREYLTHAEQLNRSKSKCVDLNLERKRKLLESPMVDYLLKYYFPNVPNLTPVDPKSWAISDEAVEITCKLKLSIKGTSKKQLKQFVKRAREQSSEEALKTFWDVEIQTGEKDFLMAFTRRELDSIDTDSDEPCVTITRSIPNLFEDELMKSHRSKFIVQHLPFLSKYSQPNNQKINSFDASQIISQSLKHLVSSRTP
eukprot:GHVT01026138.1.p1 GENE.GHVT01026138.1~~GHVT01026138.1.p1  ORF type:complete len:527 (+),score=29.72 GHVT01026138.1:933-2513(+)